MGGTIRVPGINVEIVFSVSQHRCSVHGRELIGSHRDATISILQALLGGTIRVLGVNYEIVFTVSHFAVVHYTHTHPFNGPLSRTTRVSRYQKGKTNLDFTEASDSWWQFHQLDHMQICTSLLTNNHASTPPLSFYRPDALPAAQPTASKH